MGKGVSPKFRTSLPGSDATRVCDCGNLTKIQAEHKNIMSLHP